MIVASLVESLLVTISPPPETVATLITIGATLTLTLTVTTIAGYEAPGASGLTVVHVSVPSEHVHPAPRMDVATRPAGSVSTTVTAPVVAPPPPLCTTMV